MADELRIRIDITVPVPAALADDAFDRADWVLDVKGALVRPILDIGDRDGATVECSSRLVAARTKRGDDPAPEPASAAAAGDGGTTGAPAAQDAPSGAENGAGVDRGEHTGVGLGSALGPALGDGWNRPAVADHAEMDRLTRAAEQRMKGSR